MDEISVDLEESEIPFYKRFFEIYETESAIHTDVLEKTYLGDRGRVCRFCGRSHPDVKFKSQAHVFAQAIGNRYLLNNFECDNCNSRFGKYENSFANYTDYLRKMVGAVNNNKRGSDKKRKDITEIKKGGDVFSTEEGTEFYLDAEDRNSFKIDQEKKQAEFEITIKPYIPIYIYKTVLKVALCCVKQSDISNFKKAFEILQLDNLSTAFRRSGYFQIFESSVPGGLEFIKPYGILYSRKPEHKNDFYPDKTFCFFFANRVWQIFLPLNLQDAHLAGNKFTVLRSPLPLVKGFIEQNGNVSREILDLSSEEMRRNEKKKLVLKFI